MLLSLAKVLLFYDIFIVLVGPFCDVRLRISQISCTFASFLQALASALSLFCVWKSHKKKVWTSVISGNSGFDSYRLQYTQKVHTYGANIHYIAEVYSNLSKIELLLNKVNN